MIADIDKIEEHLANAEHKHPHFADRIISDETRELAADILSDARKLIATDKEQGCVIAEGLLICEMAEIMDAYSDGRFADAIEECYDAIAVLLRMVEMIGKEANVNNNNGNNINKETN